MLIDRGPIYRRPNLKLSAIDYSPAGNYSFPEHRAAAAEVRNLLFASPAKRKAMLGIGEVRP